jgi:hypothetical protein
MAKPRDVEELFVPLWLRYRLFVSRVVRAGRVWTYGNEKGAIVLRGHDGAEAMSFYATADEAATMCIGPLRDCGPHYIELEKFLSRWLVGMQADGVRVMVADNGQDYGAREPQELAQDIANEQLHGGATDLQAMRLLAATAVGEVLAANRLNAHLQPVSTPVEHATDRIRGLTGADPAKRYRSLIRQAGECDKVVFAALGHGLLGMTFDSGKTVLTWPEAGLAAASLASMRVALGELSFHTLDPKVDGQALADVLAAENLSIAAAFNSENGTAVGVLRFLIDVAKAQVDAFGYEPDFLD